jgi:hypothetical protein
MYNKVTSWSKVFLQDLPGYEIHCSTEEKKTSQEYGKKNVMW